MAILKLALKDSRSIALTFLGRGLLCAPLICSGSVLNTTQARILDHWPRLKLTADARPEVIFDWKHEKCELWDAPDAPLRAFRSNSGNVVALASDSHNRPFIGSTLTTIKHDCKSVYLGHNSSNPADYSGLSYVVSTWTTDGRHVSALVHNEYHADFFPGACTYKESSKCWWNAIVAVKSEDGGQTFNGTEPPTLVAAPYFPQTEGQGRRRGFFNSSNIIESNGAYYTFISTTGGARQPNGVCLFRTLDISNQQSWRGFDGSGFTSRALDPYRESVKEYIPCLPIKSLPGVVNTVVYNKEHGLFLSLIDLGKSQRWPTGGVVYSWSQDMINWTEPSMLLERAHLTNSDCSDIERFGYSSILDPESTSPNFDTIGNNPFLYQTRAQVVKCGNGPERDLIRLSLEIVSD